MEINAREKFHRYRGVVTPEHDALDEELEQLLALVHVGDGEQGVEVLQDVAELGCIERLAGHAIDVGLHPGEIVFEQPEVALLQRELPADRLEPGAALGDGVDQAVHLCARLADADEQRRLFATKWLCAVIVVRVRGGDGVVE
nr:hypothetical protein [Kofleriaceae bacterium]